MARLIGSGGGGAERMVVRGAADGLDDLLYQWGDWARAGQRVVGGFGRETALGRVMRLGPNGAAIHGGGGFIDCRADEPALLEAIDQAVASVKAGQRKVGEALERKYWRDVGLSDEQHALRLGVSLASFRVYVSSGKRQVADWLIAKKLLTEN